MSRSASTAPAGPTLLLGVVAFATTWMALTAWQGFLAEPRSLLGRAFVVGLVVVAVGTVLRWRAVPRWLIALAQVVVVTLVVSWQITGSPLPSGEIGHALATAVDTARTYSAPVGPRVPALWPLLLVCAAVFLVLVDTIACTFRRVPGAGLALLAIYSVPSGLLDEGPGWVGFALTALGFLVLLHLDAREHLFRWGRALGPKDSTPWRHGHPVREAAKAGAGRIGITATVLALVVPLFVPVLSTDLFDLGSGGNGGDIRIRKPIADMRRDLERGEDVPLVRVATDDPAPSYLRISVLNRFTGQEWSSGDRDVPQENTADGALPAPVGLSESVPRAQYDYEVQVTDQPELDLAAHAVPGRCGAGRGRLALRPHLDGLPRRRRRPRHPRPVVLPDLDRAALRHRRTLLPRRTRRHGARRDARACPPGIPAIARDLARSVTQPAKNDYERALMLQRFFRSDGGFTYDLRRAPAGTGNDTLESFLAPGGRVGYCEQYASAMAVMARVVGIPARVAVGFLEPTRMDDGRWEYSSHDLHAWPEPVLRRRRLGALRADPVRPGRERPRLLPGPGRPQRGGSRRRHQAPPPPAARRPSPPAPSRPGRRRPRPPPARRTPVPAATPAATSPSAAGCSCCCSWWPRCCWVRGRSGPRRVVPGWGGRAGRAVGRGPRHRPRPRRALARGPLPSRGRHRAARPPRRSRRTTDGAPADRRRRRTAGRRRPRTPRARGRARPLRPARLGCHRRPARLPRGRGARRRGVERGRGSAAATPGAVAATLGVAGGAPALTRCPEAAESGGERRRCGERSAAPVQRKALEVGHARPPSRWLRSRRGPDAGATAPAECP
ncbi:transglutaminase domain-containing protein [Nocardioides sp. W3-2-3]|uniref:transglutaminase family protein n=1 Tax=Nocardioides convexus TaxID=2712224 RepID=UPI002418A164|nr:DUF3488 and transglutaminase-like domain-containing protein [Nocardioides convexus]NGZ99992.1 transglutaminase domain-containing protein [Nocardioides convexus]